MKRNATKRKDVKGGKQEEVNADGPGSMGWGPWDHGDEVLGRDGHFQVPRKIQTQKQQDLSNEKNLAWLGLSTENRPKRPKRK